ncbi:MAG: TIGR01244 family sulfur transferase [Pseudomonadota bacterium]|nr:TIGR01244 family sulfur transferase [Pseudomonadota bacterium]
MKINSVDAGFSVAPQILASDMTAVAAAGFRSVICNRPDGEGSDQPPFSEIEAAARAAGLAAIYQPVEPGRISDAQVAAFAGACAAAGGPVLAYCRTGTRSITLWSLGQAGRRPLPEILACASAAGYDLMALAPRIDSRAAAP